MNKPVDLFIAEHTYINYCEAIVHKDGSVEYVCPSHTNTLIRITGEGWDDIYNKIPIWDSPIDWLVAYTGCIAVWTKGYISPSRDKVTDQQIETMEKLINAGLVEAYNFRKIEGRDEKWTRKNSQQK